jgi:aminopeptidase N
MRYRTLALFALFLLAFTGSTGVVPAPAAPFDFDRAFGRLPKNVVPTDYAIALVPNVDARTIAGTESIALRVRSATKTIQFNTLNETLRDVRFDGNPVAKVVNENGKQLTTLTLPSAAPVGMHRLTFAYAARMETSPQGLFVQPYRTAAGTERRMIATMFESTDARRMFPCWDEPAFRATFALRVTIPAAWVSQSNMPLASRVVNGRFATVTFQRSPKMPTYLLEFAAGDLAMIKGSSNGTLLRVVAVKGAQNDGRIAIANAKQILADYDAYFGFPYPLPKLDSIAMPGGFQGGMENWGAIVYTDHALLLNASSTMADRQQVYSIQAHEMAHQWNGDLVTMGWWDDLWLNESFASWRAAKETDLRHPSWHWWEEEDLDKEGAMDADARLTSHPIAVHIADEAQSENAFDPEITYAKGQAFLRMLEAYLGDDTFRDGIRRYIKARAFSNATGTDLWNALSAASGQDVARISETWTSVAGFPLVSVAASCDAGGHRTIALTQQRFLLGSRARNASHWLVPLSIRTGAAAPITSLLLTSDGQTVAAGMCADPLLLNAGTTGFYRVAYDDATLDVDRKNFGALANADRIALLDDQWALVRAGRAKLASYLGLATSMGEDNDARAWEQIAGALGQIEVAERGKRGYTAYLAYARSVIAPLAKRLGWTPKAGEAPDLQDLRRTIVGDLGVWGDKAAIAEANRRMAAFVRNRRAIAADDQQFILGIVANHADAKTFAELRALAASAKNDTERSRYYAILAGVRDPKLARQALQLVMSSALPPQLAAQRIDFVRAAAAYNPAIAWPVVRGNFDALVTPQGPSALGFAAQALPEDYWRAVPLAGIKAFLVAKVPSDLTTFVNKGMERAQFDQQLDASLATATDAYLRASNG